MAIYIPHASKMGVDFPHAFELKILFSRDLVNFHPWYFLDGAEAQNRESLVLPIDYVETNIVFCQRFDGDDVVAAFDVVEGLIKCIDVESRNVKGTYDSFWDFFRYVVEEMIDFNDEI